MRKLYSAEAGADCMADVLVDTDTDKRVNNGPCAGSWIFGRTLSKIASDISLTHGYLPVRLSSAGASSAP